MNKEKEIIRLTKIWYQIVNLGHHKDKDCHWYIYKIWSYGESPKYSVEHYGYILGDISEKFNTCEEAHNFLLKTLKEVMINEKESAEKVLKEPEKWTDKEDSMWGNEIIDNAKKVLEILKEKNVATK